MAESKVHDELWQQFHEAVNMTSRELSEWLRESEAGTDTEQLPDQAGPSVGRQVLASWRHRLMDLGHDPLKPG